MNFNDAYINECKEEFCKLLREVDRENANIESLIAKLEASDFFTAPASSKYHNSCRGGLVDHSLNVYRNLSMLVQRKGFEDVISKDSIIICGLLHDLSKMNYYEPTARNKKVYSDMGSKSDELGRFDWVSEMGWATKDKNDRFLFGNHEETAEFMVRRFIPLKVEESVAILNHHGGMGWDSTKTDISALYAKYPLACLLHLADILSTYVDEEG